MAEAAKGKRAYAVVCFGMDLGLQTSLGRMTGIPEAIRYPPVHPDDPRAFEPNNGPISDGMTLPIVHGAFGLDLGVGYRAGRLDVRAGLVAGLGTPAMAVTKERNYTDAPGTDRKGPNAALTYYALQGDILRKGLFLEVAMRRKVGPYRYSDLFLRYEITRYGLVLENGWDRFGSLQRYQKYPVADLTTHSLRLGVEALPHTMGVFGTVRPYVGVRQTHSSPTPLGREVHFSLRIQFMAGVEFIAGRH
jgi:hypothetical protein